jgi:molybdopterin synthase catalytic subunit
MRDSLIQVTSAPLSPEKVVEQIKTDSSGCVVVYVGLIREQSRGKGVLSVEYEDTLGRAAERLRSIAGEIRQKWPIEAIAISHRVGRLSVGDINLVVAVAAAHREEGFSACQYAIDRFKAALPTGKTETYLDGSTWIEEAGG